MQIQHVRSMHGHHTGPINCIRFTYDGQYCMTAGEDKQICLFNPHKDAQIIDTGDIGDIDRNLHINISNSSSSHSNQYTGSSLISPFATAAASNRIQQSNKESLFIKKYTGIHGYAVLTLDISHDNSFFVSAGYDRSVFYWDVTTGQIIRRFKNTTSQTSTSGATGSETHSTNRINTVKLNGADNSLLFTGGYDRTVCIWDLKSRNNSIPLQTLTDFQDSVSKLMISDYEVIASCIDGSLYTYDLRVGKLHKDEVQLSYGNEVSHGDRNHSNSYSKRKSPLVSCSLSVSHKLVLVNCLGYEMSGDTTTSASFRYGSGNNGALGVIEKRSGRLLSTLYGHQNIHHNTESSFLFNDTHVCTGSEDGQLYVYDLLSSSSSGGGDRGGGSSGSNCYSFGLHSAGISSLCTHTHTHTHSSVIANNLKEEDNDICDIVTASYNGEASLWRLTL